MWSLDVTIFAKGGGMPFGMQLSKQAAALVRAERAKLDARMAAFEQQVMKAAAVAAAEHANDPPGKHEFTISGDLDLPSK